MSGWLKSFNPANGDLVGEVAVANAEDVNEAVARAREALAGWQGQSLESRGDLILRAADALWAQESWDTHILYQGGQAFRVTRPAAAEAPARYAEAGTTSRKVKMSPGISSLLTVALVSTLLGGCAGGAPKAPSSAPPAVESSEAVPAPAPGQARDRELPQFDNVEDEVRYYISRMPDRYFVGTYGGEEHPRPWYIAAERLGQIGEPAIPPLVSRLDTPDEYELMLVLYALMLASQDAALMAATGGDYVELGTVLDPSHNAENRTRALAWWQRHSWRWQ